MTTQPLPLPRASTLASGYYLDPMILERLYHFQDLVREFLAEGAAE